MKTTNNLFITAMYLIRKAYSYSKAYMGVIGVEFVLSTLHPFVNVILPKHIIDEFFAGSNPSQVFFLIGLTAGLNLIFAVGIAYCQKYLNSKTNFIDKKFDLDLSICLAETEYQNLENPRVLEQVHLAKDSKIRAGSVADFIRSFFSLLAQIGMAIGFVYLLVNLVQSDGFAFQSTGYALLDFLAKNSGVIILVLLGLSILNGWLTQKETQRDFKFFEEFAIYGRKHGYYMMLVNNYNIGKDIRLNQLGDLLSRRIKDFFAESDRRIHQKLQYQIRFQLAIGIFSEIQFLLIYAFIGLKVFLRVLTLGDFYLYASSITRLIQTLQAAYDNVWNIKYRLDFFQSFVNILELPSANTKGHLSVPEEDLVFAFEGVTFKYPATDETVLENLSIEITPYNSMAIVGLNGAGKTTFIKLLLRFYDPTAGCITLNGVDINDYDLEEYWDLFSVVFQDFKLTDFTVKNNIVGSYHEKESLIVESIAKVDLTKRIGQMDAGLDTSLYTNYDETGIQVSGGEAQKIALARAIYKDTPIIILDEPTAALDPLAEFEVYSNFVSIAKDKTTFFISHRLSSCRFCDEIFVINGKHVAERGSHEELVNSSGLYAEMWNAQAQYYQK